MKKILLVFLVFTSLINAQKKDVTNQDIWTGAFRAERLYKLNPMKNADDYTVLNYDSLTHSNSIDKYSYKTLKKLETIVNSKNLDSINYIDDYTFDASEKQLILGTQEKQIYRHSKLGTYYVYNINTKKLLLISKHKIQEPSFSPDGKKVAFVFKNNIYIKSLENNKTSQITFDGKKNEIINGLSDWVYEEEYAFVKAYHWNATSTKIAYFKFNEKDVPEITFMKYGHSLYPKTVTFKYPKAGEKNAKVDLYFYDLNTNKTQQVNLGDYHQYYLPRMQWINNENTLCVTSLNRHQNKLDLVLVNANSLKVSLLFNESNTTYINITNNLTFLKDNSFIWTSEKDGFNHIYHYNKIGKLQHQVTKGNWEITHYYGYNAKTDRIFYQSTENGSINRTIYSIKLNGRDKKLLSQKTNGTNSAAFSKSFNYYINTYSDANTPYIYTLNSAKNGKVLKDIINNNQLVHKLKNYNLSPKEFFTLKTKNGDFNAWMIKPTNFDPTKKYPLFMYQYSGPGSQSVSNSWMNSNDFWYESLAAKGYIIACVDGRGTGFRGAAFERVTYKELGKYEVADQIEAAKVLGKRPYIDANEIGIWGWSYGGFMSSNAILKGNDVFKMAIAVAPVTSWRFYDTVYTERYMQTPQENPSGYDQNSPINFVDRLKGKYLLIHGTGDDNVHVENTMQMIEALVGANKQFDLFVYPDKNHGIYGSYNDKGNVRLNLYQKMTTFIEQNLKTKKTKPQQIKIKG